MSICTAYSYQTPSLNKFLGTIILYKLRTCIIILGKKTRIKLAPGFLIWYSTCLIFVLFIIYLCYTCIGCTGGEGHQDSRSTYTEHPTSQLPGSRCKVEEGTYICCFTLHVRNSTSTVLIVLLIGNPHPHA